MAEDQSVDLQSLVHAITVRDEHLRTTRSDVEAYWQEISEYVLPRRATFTEEVSTNVKRNRHILDSTAPRSLELFASFFHTMMSNPARKWFRMGIMGQKVENLPAMTRQWLEAVEDRMMAEMEGQSSRLYTQLHTLYLDIGAFGSGVLYEDAPFDQLRVQNFHLSDVVWEENAFGQVHAVYRRFKMSPNQAKSRWPDRDLGKSLESTRNQPDTLDFIHAVFPATKGFDLAEKLPGDLKLTTAFETPGGPQFASVFINATDRRVIEIGTFQEFPYQIPRWYRVQGQPTGRSPAMTVFPDIKMVNRMMETILRGAEKLVDPPLMVPDGGLVSPIRLFPGGITFTEGQTDPKPLIPPGASRIDVGDQLLQQRQQAIRDGFFVSLFLTPDSPVKTATQVLQEVNERNQALAPMLLRQQDELFHGLIARVFGLLNRLGRFPDPPPELQGQELDISFVNPLNSSQQQVEGMGTLRIMESLAPWAQIDPSVFDLFDPDAVAKTVFEASGAPASILRSSRAIAGIRQQRQQAQQQQQQFAQATEGMSAAADLIKATGGGQRGG
jgi:hypothetical protein